MNAYSRINTTQASVIAQATTHVIKPHKRRYAHHLLPALLSREYGSAAAAHPDAAEEFFLLAGTCTTHAVVNALPDLLDAPRLGINDKEY